MDVEKLDILESRLLHLVNLIAELREKNQLLESRVTHLEGEISAKTEEVDRLKRENEEVAQLREESKNLLKERDLIRLKIEGMLSSLEKTGLSGL
ncbi:MAG: hypothetical protein HY731_01380 [Candidatus Tectomicrobia bacterium]|nr:hypothetical protein [Candidatus Tectomicrobia bacterium]